VVRAGSAADYPVFSFYACARSLTAWGGSPVNLKQSRPAAVTFPLPVCLIDAGVKMEDTEQSRMRSDTRMLGDGGTVLVRLRVNRRAYELARWWAEFHSGAMPDGTAEDQLEGYLNAAMADALDSAPDAFKAAWPAPAAKAGTGKSDMDDGIPF
jgi:hypothetical protein